MASYSSGIQLDVDSISLSPSEIRDSILNDGTEFAGANIEYLSGSFNRYNFGINRSVNNDSEYDVLTATGTGSINRLELTNNNIQGGNGYVKFRVSVDGRNILTLDDYDENTTYVLNGPIRFNSEMRVYADNGYGTDKSYDLDGIAQVIFD